MTQAAAIVQRTAVERLAQSVCAIQADAPMLAKAAVHLLDWLGCAAHGSTSPQGLVFARWLELQAQGYHPTLAGRSSDAAAAAAQLRARSETAEFEAYSQEFIEATLVKALFPQDQERRMFLRAVGKKTAMAAIASVLPVASLQAMAQEKGPLEKPNLKIGFIPITCATPLIMAHPLGFYSKQGLNVEVTKTAGWP
mgnify:CR=1 FL=1